jgi:hypothetical protein
MESKDTQLPAAIKPAEIVSDQRVPNVVPALVAFLGEEAAWRYVEVFIANIRNHNKQRVYFRLQSLSSFLAE